MKPPVRAAITPGKSEGRQRERQSGEGIPNGLFIVKLVRLKHQVPSTKFQISTKHQCPNDQNEEQTHSFME
jgi:hypothetical protein